MLRAGVLPWPEPTRAQLLPSAPTTTSNLALSTTAFSTQSLSLLQRSCAVLGLLHTMSYYYVKHSSRHNDPCSLCRTRGSKVANSFILVRVPVWDLVKLKTFWCDIGWTCNCLNSYLPEFAQYVLDDHEHDHCGVGMLPKFVRYPILERLKIPYDSIHWGGCPSQVTQLRAVECVSSTTVHAAPRAGFGGFVQSYASVAFDLLLASLVLYIVLTIGQVDSPPYHPSLPVPQENRLATNP